MTISDRDRKQVRARANYLCEYYHSLEEASAALFEIDHILPKSLGGSDNSTNRNTYFIQSMSAEMGREFCLDG